ncbi:MAG: manganese efflux pump [Clostridia bacterium]|nr:manganese efflux pump [Clostridia bacterium]
MDWLTLLLISVGLATDAFAVSVGNGIFLGRATPLQSAKIAGAFGLFQGVMPIFGYLLASLFAAQIVAVDHWIAFVLLAFIGGKMLWEVFRGEEESCAENPLQWRTLLLSAVATSIDAMAVGVTMALGRTGLLEHDLGFLLCAAVIALVTFALCLIGVQVGCKTGRCFGRRAQIAGGLVLIGIGIKILVEHLWL